MDYIKTKIYFDGSHYIGIPKTAQYWKRRKHKSKPQKNETETKVKEKLSERTNETKQEKTKRVINELNVEIKNIAQSKNIVDTVIKKYHRNRIVRLTRLSRKVGLQKWTHFCTFTYDSNKLTETEFREKFLNCIRHLSNRKGWKYIGVFERSPELQRLHFHGIFVIPEMVGEIIETKDYSTKTHQMQIAHQNTFFLTRFGRNDFKPIEDNAMAHKAVRYILKYIRKTGEKVIYSKHLQTYFVTDVMEDDVVCTIGQENRKILLFDDFQCWDLVNGKLFGTVSKELIDSLPKAF